MDSRWHNFSYKNTKPDIKIIWVAEYEFWAKCASSIRCAFAGKHNTHTRERTNALTISFQNQNEKKNEKTAGTAKCPAISPAAGRALRKK